MHLQVVFDEILRESAIDQKHRAVFEKFELEKLIFRMMCHKNEDVRHLIDPNKLLRFNNSAVVKVLSELMSSKDTVPDLTELFEISKPYVKKSFEEDKEEENKKKEETKSEETKKNNFIQFKNTSVPSDVNVDKCTLSLKILNPINEFHEEIVQIFTSGNTNSEEAQNVIGGIIDYADDAVHSNKIVVYLPELFKAFFHVQKLKTYGILELIRMLGPRYKKIAGATEMLEIVLLCIDLGTKEIQNKDDLMKCIKLGIAAAYVIAKREAPHAIPVDISSNHFKLLLKGVCSIIELITAMLTEDSSKYTLDTFLKTAEDAFTVYSSYIAVAFPEESEQKMKELENQKEYVSYITGL